MNKLINKNTIQYIKHGYVLYGQKRTDINKYGTGGELAKKWLTENKSQQFTSAEISEIAKAMENYMNINYKSRDPKSLSMSGVYDKFFKGWSMTPDGYGQNYKDMRTLGISRNTSLKILKTRKQWSNDKAINDQTWNDIADKWEISSTNSFKAENFGKYHNDQNVGYGDYNGQKVAVRYNKDSKTWTYNPIDDNENKWIDADDELSKYLNQTYKGLQTPAKKSEEAKKEEPSKPGLAPDTTKPNTAKPDVVAPDVATPDAVAPGTDDAGSLVNYFDPLVTDPRTILRSTRLEKPVTTVTKPKTTLRVLPKAVARPENMPLMNRSDVRYTISDITGSSPYASSDIELVNSLANTSDKNMFKQALMNRLKMSKWDNEVALNRLNSLGIKGHIGGSDRKRLRNLINKGTTINGKIRS